MPVQAGACYAPAGRVPVTRRSRGSSKPPAPEEETADPDEGLEEIVVDEVPPKFGESPPEVPPATAAVPAQEEERDENGRYIYHPSFIDPPVDECELDEDGLTEQDRADLAVLRDLPSCPGHSLPHLSGVPLMTPPRRGLRGGAPLWGLAEAAALAVGEALTRRRSRLLGSVEAAVLAAEEVQTSGMAWAGTACTSLGAGLGFRSLRFGPSTNIAPAIPCTDRILKQRRRGCCLLCPELPPPP